MVELFQDSINRSREFYKHNLPELPPDSQWHQYRFRLWNGTMVVLKAQIKTSEQLQSYLVKYAPSDVYFMTTCFLNPAQVGPKKYTGTKAGYKWANNIILNSGFFVDVDVDCGVKVVSSVLAFLKRQYHFHNSRILKTLRGYQIHVYDDILKTEEKQPYPSLLEQQYVRKKSEIVSAIEKEFPSFVFDKPISLDTRRVVRVSNTLHNSGVKIETIAN